MVIAGVRIDPLERIGSNDGVEPARRFVFLERHTDYGHVRHARRVQVLLQHGGETFPRFQCRDDQPTLRQWDRQLSGPRPDLQHMGTSNELRPVDQQIRYRLRELWSTAVIVVRDPIEGKPSRAIPVEAHAVIMPRTPYPALMPNAEGPESRCSNDVTTPVTPGRVRPAGCVLALRQG